MAAKSSGPLNGRVVSFYIEDNFLPPEEQLHSRVWMAGLQI